MPSENSRLSKLVFPGILAMAMLSVAVGTFVTLHGLRSTAGDTDPFTTGSVVDPAAAGTSFSYSYNLAKLLAARCGVVDMTALQAASESEAAENGALAAQAAIEAETRAGTITSRGSCSRILVEVEDENKRALHAGY